ncbi:MAG: ESX secretion-associated protein EspG [Actinomycetaceae bacterium]|nr:ESX secretion-associated protein EspG [Actinomycetaceae bacterium]
MSLRIPEKSWHALQAMLDGKSPSRQALRELQDLGVLDNLQLAPATRQLLRGFADATYAVRIFGNDGRALRRATLWIAPDRHSLLEQSDELVSLSSLEPGMLPPAVIDLLGLGPRLVPSLTEPQRIPVNYVSELLDPSGATKGEPWADLAAKLRPMWPEVFESIVNGRWQSWLIQSYDDVKHDPPRVRETIYLLDTPKGLLGIDLEDDAAVLTPITTMALWRRLSYLLAPGT